MKKGDKLFVTFGDKGEYQPITKLGPKFITFELYGWKEVQFHRDTLRQRSEYTPDYKLWESEQAHIDYCEFHELRKFINKKLNEYNHRATFTIEQLRGIAKILRDE